MKHFFILTIILVLQLLFQSSETAPLTNETKNVESLEYRLPTTISPLNYTIVLTPYILRPNKDKKIFVFDGSVSIYLEINNEVNEIVLHKNKIEITDQKLLKNGNESLPVDIIDDDFNDITNLLTLKLSQKLGTNTIYLLKFNYTGEMSTDMKGFYRSSYTDKTTKKEVWIGATQFQTHHARRAFPCFDEPQFKAEFTISINHEKEFQTVVSNMPAKKTPAQPTADDRVLTEFETTPKMSTYIIAFLISNFDGPGFGEDFSILARPEYKDQTQFSYQDGQKILKALNKYIGIDYNTLGIKKMDMAAIPDFSAGAMENWGLLTYRERGLLFDEKETTAAAQQRISLVIAHEQTHMWFGDYVTCDWWSHTWLNEGFARYFQYFGSHQVEDYKNWDLDKQFVVDQIHSVFVTDSLENTHAMSETNINTPADYKKMFDSISYNKGASIIRMFRYAMGEKIFHAALKNYLNSKNLQNARPEDLFAAFNNEWKSTDPKTKKFFTDWTEQVGYPIVTVKLVDDGKAIKVSQKRYLLEDVKGDKELLYTIPFTYTTQKKPKFQPENIQFINEKEEKIELPDEHHLSKSDYLIANIEQIGYFRVMYDEPMLHNIHAALDSEKFGEISEINRAHFIDDLFNFARSGHLTYKTVLDILSYLKNELHYIPWTAAFNGFKYIETKLAKDNNDLKEHLHKILPKVYDKLKFVESKEDTRLDIYNRVNVLSWACKYDYKDCNQQSKKIFEDSIKEKDPKVIDKNIRSVVYCSVLRNDKETKTYNTLKKRFIETEIATEKTLILNSLGCVQNKDHIETHYDFILSDTVRKQDKPAALSALIAENPDSPEHVFNLISKDHTKLGESFGNGDDDVVSVITNIASRFTTTKQKELIEKFIENSKLSESAKESLKKSTKNIEKNIAWLKKYGEELVDALKGGVAAKTFSSVLIVFTTILCYTLSY